MKQKTLLIILGLGSCLLVCCVVGVVGIVLALGAAKKSVNDDIENSTLDFDQIVQDLEDEMQNGESQNDYDEDYYCLYASTANPETIPGYTFELAVTEETEIAWGEHWQDTGGRKISLSDLESYYPKEHLYATYYRNDGSYIANYDVWFQVCDSENRTNYSSYLSDINNDYLSGDPGDGQSYSSYTELTAFGAPAEKGTYRVDLLAFVDNQWKLVERMEDVEFY